MTQEPILVLHQILIKQTELPTMTIIKKIIITILCINTLGSTFNAYAMDLFDQHPLLAAEKQEWFPMPPKQACDAATYFFYPQADPMKALRLKTHLLPALPISPMTYLDSNDRSNTNGDTSPLLAPKNAYQPELLNNVLCGNRTRTRIPLLLQCIANGCDTCKQILTNKRIASKNSKNRLWTRKHIVSSAGARDNSSVQTPQQLQAQTLLQTSIRHLIYKGGYKNTEKSKQEQTRNIVTALQQGADVNALMQIKKNSVFRTPLAWVMLLGSPSPQIETLLIQADGKALQGATLYPAIKNQAPLLLAQALPLTLPLALPLTKPLVLPSI